MPGLLSTISSLALVLSPLVPGTITSCDSTSKFIFNQATLDPPAPLPKQNVTAMVQFTNNYKLVENGTTTYQINLNGLPYSYSENLCSYNLPCPISLGDHTVYASPINVTDITGKLVIKTTYTDIDDTVLLCITVVLKLPN